MLHAEEFMKKNDQFFYFGDVILFQILYTSKRCKDMLGVEPSALNSIEFFNLLHPEEMSRNILMKNILTKTAQKLFLEEKGHQLLSTNFRIKNAKGKYMNMLSQFLLFYSTVPYKSVFSFKVHTNIDWYKSPKNCCHYYLGDDLTNFRYPDRALLQTGSIFTKHEFEIIQLLEKGFSTEQVAEHLFLSPLTIKTHRRNILQKSGKANFTELLFDLRENGFL
jgi:DNA-binding CsgD family transcriptional regulator